MPLCLPELNPAQARFNDTYITSTEIMRDLGISRATLLNARRTGRLPEAIVVNDGQLYMWERNSISDYLQAWKTILVCRRGAN